MENAERKALRRRDLDPDPIRQFRCWLAEAEGAGVAPPHGMTLATANRQGEPAARVVLLRGVDERGFVFYSNYRSRKGEELAQNPQAALLFYWPELVRQVRVEGRVELLTAAE
ncbi:Pyridoxine/pyridoxamine 5'-phosphate oxidase [Desulfuromonas sp. DDH964]|nr:pyridoxal 5'-phosphate synthase [Desulfuromonas sp. DDH964]AMV70968.1 Pyridoxine/pyridoxamine 5'-phosphate oxidase [Desulfuromonas sp. DDH964]